MKPRYHPIAVLATVILSAFIVYATTYADERSNGADNQYNYAHYLFTQGQYLSAAAEFQRFAYFFPDDPRHDEARLKIGESLLKGGQIEAAIAQLNALTETPRIDTVVVESFFVLAECYLRLNREGQALIPLHNLIVLKQDVQIHDRAYYQIGWINIGQLNWKEARDAFAHISSSGKRRYRMEEISGAIDESNAISRKIPGLAGVLSILPGAGQLYCGRYEDALIAFVVDIGLFWASYESYDHQLNVLGTLLAIVGTGFYTSNIYSAVSSAHKINRDRQYRHVEEMKNRFMLTIGTDPIALNSSPAIGIRIKF
jgi:tetratricopeptide (TPR) repeat protein